MTDVETAKSEPGKPAQNQASNGQQAKPEDMTTAPKPDDVPKAPNSEDVPNAPTPALADGGEKEEKAPGYAQADQPGKKSRYGSTRSRPDESVVLERGVKGTIKWYNSLRGFGFIMRKDTAEDVFVHKTHFLTVRSWVLPCPRKDDEVEFDVLKGAGGRYEAAAVSAPNGTLVRGRPAPRERRQFAPVRPANAQPLVKAKNVVPEVNRDDPRMVFYSLIKQLSVII
ncbi:Y box protein 2 [Aphelenchoides avenae]|nr:Y box protein 2 [Aphelenchus avenae]